MNKLDGDRLNVDLPDPHLVIMGCLLVAVGIVSVVGAPGRHHRPIAVETQAEDGPLLWLLHFTALLARLQIPKPDGSIEARRHQEGRLSPLAPLGTEAHRPNGLGVPEEFLQWLPRVGRPDPDGTVIAPGGQELALPIETDTPDAAFVAGE